MMMMMMRGLHNVYSKIYIEMYFAVATKKTNYHSLKFPLIMPQSKKRRAGHSELIRRIKIVSPRRVRGTNDKTAG